MGWGFCLSVNLSNMWMPGTWGIEGTMSDPLGRVKHACDLLCGCWELNPSFSAGAASAHQCGAVSSPVLSSFAAYMKYCLRTETLLLQYPNDSEITGEQILPPSPMLWMYRWVFQFKLFSLCWTCIFCVFSTFFASNVVILPFSCLHVIKVHLRPQFVQVWNDLKDELLVLGNKFMLFLSCPVYSILL